MPSSLSTIQYIERYREEGYVVLTTGTIRSKTPIVVRCPAGHEYSTSPAKWALGRRCQVCTTHRGDRLDWQNLLDSVLQQGYRVQRLDGRLKGSCPLGHAIDTDEYNLGRNRALCGTCGHIQGGRTHLSKHRATFEAHVKSRGYSLSSEYRGQHEHIDLTCPMEHKYRVSGMGFTQGHSCPKCQNHGTSRPEQEILEYVSSLVPNVQSKVRDIIFNPTTGRALELDIYVPSCRLAIEFHGLYWHSSEAPDFQPGRSALKAKLCREAGVKFFCVFEDEWKSKQELVKAMIRYRVGKFEGVALNARDLTVKKLEKNKDFEMFFERNHLDGHRKASFAIALFLGDKLVQAASFSKSRGHTGLECIRLATDIDYRVKGGAARIFSKVAGSIMTYSNNRLSEGNVYESLGFKEDTKTTAPSYWYTEGNVRIWRFSCKRDNSPHVLASYPTENLQALGGVFGQRILGKAIPLYRIEDCGHRKWFR